MKNDLMGIYHEMLLEASNTLVAQQQQQRQPIGLPQQQYPIQQPVVTNQQQSKPSPKNYNGLSGMLDKALHAHNQQPNNTMINQSLDAINQWLNYIQQHLSQR